MKKAISKNQSGNESSLPTTENEDELSSDDIKAVIDEFERESEENGLDAAAKSFGVTRLVKELGEVARFRRRGGIELDEMVRGARVARILKEYGAGIPELEAFLSTAYAKAMEMGYTPEALVSQVAALNDLEKRYSATFDELKVQYESMANEIMAIQIERDTLHQEIVELEKRKEKARDEQNKSELHLEQYLELKQKLDGMNLSIERVDNLLKLVLNISSKNDIDTEAAFSRFEEDILANYDAVNGLKADILRLKEEERQVTDQVSKARRQFELDEGKHSEKLKEIDEKYSKVANEINDLEGKHIDVNRILSWDQILQKAGVDLPTFESKLKNYASLKTLEKEVSQKVIELMSEATSLKESISKLKSGKTD